MVNRALLEKGYRSRPRRSVAVRGFISLLVVGMAFAFLFLYLNRPDLFAFLDNVQTSYPEPSSTLRDLFDFYYAHVLISALLLLYPLVRVLKTASLRAIHWLLAFPALALEIALVVCWALFCIPPVAENFDAALVLDMQSKWIGLALYSLMGLLAFSSFIEMLYCSFPCIKYRQIYRLRREAISYAKKHRKEGTSRSPRETKCDFYRLYAKQKYDDLLDLLYVYVCDKVGEGQLNDGEFHYFASRLSQLDGKIRKAELAYLRDKKEYALMKAIHDRLAKRASSSDCGQRKAAEDAACEKLSRESEERRVAPSFPCATKSEPVRERPSSPVPPPSTVGEAWRKGKK